MGASFDLLTTVEYGGCSAKIPAARLSEALSDLPRVTDNNLLVDIETHDDAGVYRLTEDLAMIQTTDFFPPICSDAYEFGQIAAANSLSDIYAMGGRAVTALNLVMFPHNRIPLEVLKEMLAGGMDKVREAGAVIVGGHTIDDYPPKYGLAATGLIHPKRIITNAGARPGEVLIVTKAVGTGVIVAGKRIGEAMDDRYSAALEGMKQLNAAGAELMREYEVRGATDITGFGVLGHALKMALASGVTIALRGDKVPRLAGAYELADLGCIPGAAFRNQDYVEEHCLFDQSLDYNIKMLLLDAQTSGGLLMAIKRNKADEAVERLQQAGYGRASIVGEIVERDAQAVVVH
ncbi:MAG: selenide, water dikinase SelD [Chitinivibrionales bacterium]|nr:selenide, water dikinase SelD [Chitinivibrionales bacterium]MBD3356798.1 selenide, water dikinase SelD [Chitinivibrionales bacterium]